MIRRRPGLIASASAVHLGGCAGNQSILAPSGPQAAEIAHLSWILFALGTAVLLIVVLAVWAALRGSDRARAWLAAPGTVVWAGIAFPAVTLTALLGYGIWLTRASVDMPVPADAVRIEVVGEQWWWRVSYAGPSGQPIASANEIHIPVGRRIVLTLKSADVIHSFWVPNLGGKVDMIPGRVTTLQLRADREGVFRGACAEFCGGPHALMALEVVAQPAETFDARLLQLSHPAADPTASGAQRGQQLFQAAGCGACHTVRGTQASGVIGPDLTHVGSRRSVGIDTLPLNSSNLARFISDGQHIKPGNLMPPFRIFSDEDLGAIADYLAGLR